MTIEGVLNEELILLPKTQLDCKDFRKYLNEILDKYIELVNAIDTNEVSDFETHKKRLLILIDGIKKSILSSYRGNPFNAYIKLRNAIRNSNIDLYWSGSKFSDRTNFYRLRIKNDNYPLSRKELFHIPYELRGKVKTQRYSIPGFPSLYLSNSIYVAWEELRRPKLDDIQAVRINNTHEIDYIDLTTTKYSKLKPKEIKEKSELIKDLMMWPLIFASSIKVKNSLDDFKPEYIVPQLLLQWIRNNRTVVDAIKFSSTHIDLNQMNSIGDFYNLVIPVKDCKEVGYCKKLSASFEMTDVLSWQLNQFSIGGRGVIHRYNAKDGINPDIKKLELVKNESYPYEFSPFANLELRLNGMKLREIDF